MQKFWEFERALLKASGCPMTPRPGSSYKQSSEVVNIPQCFFGTPSRPVHSSPTVCCPDFWHLGILMCSSSFTWQKQPQKNFWCLSRIRWCDEVDSYFPRADNVLSFHSCFEKVVETGMYTWAEALHELTGTLEAWPLRIHWVLGQTSEPEPLREGPMSFMSRGSSVVKDNHLLA